MSPVLAHPISRAVALVAALAALALTAGPVATSEARGAGCDKTGAANQRSDRVDRSDARVAVKCLINAERSAGNLRIRRDLNRAAQRHSNYMFRHRCFSHQCPGEAGLDSRIRSSGYLSGASSYRYGEVIALNRDRASARDVVRQWKNSSGHRGQILSPGFEHMGVGLVARNGKVYYTVTLGAKSG
jgi:uncharacterized protein YkwD